MSTETLERGAQVEAVPTARLTTDAGWHFPVPDEFHFFFQDAGRQEPKQSAYFKIKYAIDRVLGCLLLLPSLPLISLCWLAVRLTSRGPGFYWQTRVGLGGKHFQIVKLRTMRLDAEADGPAWCRGKQDPRITLVGGILRRLHLDELPQLWNVACGDMCLVGPRPERPEITCCLEQLIPQYRLRFNVKPGVTGLSQVNIEPDTNINITRRKQILDLRYISQANLWLDARMLGATALRMTGLKGARVMRLMGLEQDITFHELQAVHYQFETCEADLWAPGKPLPR